MHTSLDRDDEAVRRDGGIVERSFILRFAIPDEWSAEASGNWLEMKKMPLSRSQIPESNYNTRQQIRYTLRQSSDPFTLLL